MKTIILSLACFACAIVSAQCPTITVPSTLQVGCSSGQTVAATANYTSNVVSRWIGPGNLNIACSGGANSIAYLNYVTTYTVEFTDTISHCIVIDSVKVVANVGKPVFNLISPDNFTLGCGGFSVVIIQMINASSTNSLQIPNNGPVTFTFGMGSYTSAPGLLTTVPYYTLNACGMYQALVRDNNSSCESSYNFVITCTNVAPPVNLLATQNLTVCTGTSAKLTATGMNTYTWSTGQNTPSISVMPSVTTVYQVISNNLSSCVQMRTVSVTVDSTCGMVWPGDCNSDGLVDNTDVFEIGLNFNNTGTPRWGASNNYIAQRANLWNQAGSFMQDKCHIDSNGDGVITAGDTLAINNNYLQTHYFKPSPQAFEYLLVVSPVNTYWYANIGLWNTLNIAASTNTNVVYGIAFELGFDPSVIDSIYMSYPSSFLTAPGQNVFFRKADFGKGKVYAANVKNTGLSVNGNGTAAVVHYKLKNTVPVGKSIPFTVSNVKSCDLQGKIKNFDTDSIAFTAQYVTALDESPELNSAKIFPNPASNAISVISPQKNLNYVMFDVTGRIVLRGKLEEDGQIEVSHLAAGAYQLSLRTENSKKTFKVVIVH